MQVLSVEPEPTHSCDSKGSSIKSLPTWEQLCSESYQIGLDSTFMEGVNSLKSSPNKLMLTIGRAFAATAFFDPSYRKFLTSSWEEIIDIIYTQEAENREITKKLSKKDLEPVSFSSLNMVQRKFQQQPCSKLTASRRVLCAKEIVKCEDAILLVGDDDLVGIELARAGFQNITVIDIDLGVLNQIEAIAAAEGLDINLQQCDIRKPPPIEIQNRDYRLVFLDPYYSLDGIVMFMNAAKQITNHNPNTTYFLSVHLLSLMRSGLEGLSPLLTELGFEIIDFKRSFNLYPVPPKTRKHINLVSRTVTKSKMIDAVDLQYFLSDALILQPKNNETLLPQQNTREAS